MTVTIETGPPGAAGHLATHHGYTADQGLLRDFRVLVRVRPNIADSTDSTVPVRSSFGGAVGAHV